jgi:DNA-binding Xre family transcriptional regulator
MATNLSDLLKRKMETERLSLRAAGERVDVAHTTIDRVLKDQSVDFDTIEKICDWLGIPVASVLDIKDKNAAMMNKISSLLALSPALAGVFSELADKVLSGEVDPGVLEELAAFTSYRLNAPLFGVSQDEKGK